MRRSSEAQKRAVDRGAGSRRPSRSLSRGLHLVISESAVIIGARIEPTFDIDQPIADMSTELERLGSIASRPPAIDRRERDHQEITQVLRTQKIRLPRGSEFTCVIHHPSH